MFVNTPGALITAAAKLRLFTSSPALCPSFSGPGVSGSPSLGLPSACRTYRVPWARPFATSHRHGWWGGGHGRPSLERGLARWGPHLEAPRPHSPPTLVAHSGATEAGGPAPGQDVSGASTLQMPGAGQTPRPHSAQQRRRVPRRWAVSACPGGHRRPSRCLSVPAAPPSSPALWRDSLWWVSGHGEQDG